MITQKEQIQLREIIGTHYTDAVLDYLNSKGERNRNGHPYSPEYVRMVFQGVRNNTDIENAIWQVAAQKKKEAKKAEKLKKQILN